MATDGKYQITLYMHTGYNIGDAPMSDAVIDMNDKLTIDSHVMKGDPGHITTITLPILEAEINHVDYMRVRDPETGERWFYWVTPQRQRHNVNHVTLAVVMDYIATVGVNNISFFGNIVRRSLSQQERQAGQYALLPEPWTPRRPLRVRRWLIDTNTNKRQMLPVNISTNFEEENTEIEKTETIEVPSTPLGIMTFPDSLTMENTIIKMGYPNVAAATQHSINTPWGNIDYETPYEAYLTLSGNALSDFLRKAKMYNSLDLVGSPYYRPAPPRSITVQIPELQSGELNNPKASRWYTTITIRALASDSTRTFSETDANLQYNQELTIIVAPDKNGGLYVLPVGMRAIDLNAFTYLDGVYSPFETIVLNAVGDTPGKFAADGTIALNTSLANLFNSYITKMNALQTEQMQAKYLKDIGSAKAVVMSFVAELFGSVSTATTTTEPYRQTSHTDTSNPSVTQRQSGRQSMPTITQDIDGTNRTGSYNVTDPGGRTDIYDNYTLQRQRALNYGAQTQTVDTRSTTYGHNIDTTGTNTTDPYTQRADSYTEVGRQVNVTNTVQSGNNRSVEEGNQIAVDGIDTIYEIAPGQTGSNPWGVLKTYLFGGYRNEMHGFMLGNINDYINRWASIQNDLHNAKVANLFKNVTLVGNYADTNKLAGKYEIIIASLQPQDALNFDIFLDHFGHAVDEYSRTLVKDAGGNFNYVMVGDDALVSNDVMHEANQQILTRLRMGVRFWKTLVRASNF